MLGKLQTNKAKKAVSIFDYVHSLDSKKLADILKKNEMEIGRKLSYFIQVNFAKDEQNQEHQLTMPLFFTTIVNKSI